jgi:hypothetical protein
MNKRKRVAWRKHRIRARKVEAKAKAEKAAGGTTAARPSARTAAAAG